MRPYLALLAFLVGAHANALQLPQLGPEISPTKDLPTMWVSNEAEETEWNPNAPDADQILRQFMLQNSDDFEGAENVLNPSPNAELLHMAGGCYRESCPVYIEVSIPKQKLYLYVNGSHMGTWKISSGLLGRTARWDGRPWGPIKRKHTSSKWPEGDWNGLGNMPYAVFYYKGFAIHGTPKGNWKRLGQPASHGCVRVHPENAKILNAYVRAAGLKNTWVYIY